MQYRTTKSCESSFQPRLNKIFEIASFVIVKLHLNIVFF